MKDFRKSCSCMYRRGRFLSLLLGRCCVVGGGVVKIIIIIVIDVEIEVSGKSYSFNRVDRDLS